MKFQDLVEVAKTNDDSDSIHRDTTLERLKSVFPAAVRLEGALDQDVEKDILPAVLDILFLLVRVGVELPVLVGRSHLRDGKSGEAFDHDTYNRCAIIAFLIGALTESQFEAVLNTKHMSPEVLDEVERAIR